MTKWMTATVRGAVMVLAVAALVSPASAQTKSGQPKPGKRAFYACLTEAMRADSVREAVDASGRPTKKGVLEATCDGQAAEALFKEMDGPAQQEVNKVSGVTSRRAGKSLWCGSFPLTPPSYTCTVSMDISQSFIDSIR